MTTITAPTWADFARAVVYAEPITYAIRDTHGVARFSGDAGPALQIYDDRFSFETPWLAADGMYRLADAVLAFPLLGYQCRWPTDVQLYGAESFQLSFTIHVDLSDEGGMIIEPID